MAQLSWPGRFKATSQGCFGLQGEIPLPWSGYCASTHLQLRYSINFVSITRGWRHRAALFLFLDCVIHNSLQKNIEENLIYGSCRSCILSSSTCEAIARPGIFWALWMSWLFMGNLISVHFSDLSQS